MKQRRQEAEVFVDTLIGTMRRAEQAESRAADDGNNAQTKVRGNTICILQIHIL
jgi:hypothetical protein